MPYDVALKKAWKHLEDASVAGRHEVELLDDTYTVDCSTKTVLSLSCNIPAKDFLAILILHYLTGISKAPYAPSGTWISFKEIEGGEIYYPAYREGAIAPLIKKFGARPALLRDISPRIPCRVLTAGDAGIEVMTFKDILVRIIVWRGDEELGPDASILFDRNISTLFTMEDIAVFARFIAHSL